MSDAATETVVPQGFCYLHAFKHTDGYTCTGGNPRPRTAHEVAQRLVLEALDVLAGVDPDESKAASWRDKVAVAQLRDALTFWTLGEEATP